MSHATNLQSVLERCQDMTPGPWAWSTSNSHKQLGQCPRPTVWNGAVLSACAPYGVDVGQGDMEAISALPDLVDASRAMATQNERLRDALAQIATGPPPVSTLLEGNDPVWREAYRNLQRIARIALRDPEGGDA